MKLGRFRKRLLSATVLVATGTTPAWAQESWQWGAELYFWGASLGGDTTSGDDVSLGIDKIIEDLKFGAMGTIAGRNGDWSVFADVIYLSLGDDASTTADAAGTRVKVDASLDLQGFITTFGGGYRVLEQTGVSLDLTGGIRFLRLDSQLEIDAAGFSIREDDSLTSTDVVVGVRGAFDLSEDWYVSYYGDVGGGDSDLTWQAAAAVNYRLNRVDLSLGYRYLDWDFDDGDFGPFDDLNLSGAFLGVKIPF